MNRLGTILTRRRLSTVVGAAVVTGIGGWGTFWFSTRHAVFRPLLDDDPLVQSHFHQAFNPHHNQALSDIYSSTIRVEDLDPKLVDDFRNGGSKLIERYCQGIFGRWGKRDRKISNQPIYEYKWGFLTSNLKLLPSNGDSYSRSVVRNLRRE